MTYSSSEFEIVVTLNSLFSDCFSDPLTVSSLELSSQQVTQPSLQQRDNTTQEEEPYSPAWSPDSASWTLSNWTLIKNIIIISANFVWSNDALPKAVIWPRALELNPNQIIRPEQGLPC